MEHLSHMDRMTIIMIIALIAFACVVIFSIWPFNYFKSRKRYMRIRGVKLDPMYRIIKTKTKKIWWRGSVHNLFNDPKRKTKE